MSGNAGKQNKFNERAILKMGMADTAYDRC